MTSPDSHAHSNFSLHYLQAGFSQRYKELLEDCFITELFHESFELPGVSNNPKRFDPKGCLWQNNVEQQGIKFQNGFTGVSEVSNNPKQSKTI